MASLAGHLIDYAERTGTKLTAEQVASIPEYQREIWAEEIARFSESAPVESAPVDVAKSMRCAGWRIVDVFVNPETGRVRLIAEKRNRKAQSGLKVMLDRQAHGSRVFQSRDLLVLRDGMYKREWEVDMSTGAGCVVSHDDMEDALHSLAARVSEDMTAIDAEAVQRALTAAIAT